MNFDSSNDPSSGIIARLLSEHRGEMAQPRPPITLNPLHEFGFPRQLSPIFAGMPMLNTGSHVQPPVATPQFNPFQVWPPMFIPSLFTSSMLFPSPMPQLNIPSQPQPSPLTNWSEALPQTPVIETPLQYTNTLFPTRAKRKKRARILKEGQLALIPYGQQEELLWVRRVAAFQNAMRGVLGDRSNRFQWSGSVIDSVIGAFLTQNVSDALSSRAYMTLASRWPDSNVGNAASRGCADVEDTVDWEAVRLADPTDVANAIKCRGMHTMLAAKIQAALTAVRSYNKKRLALDKDVEGLMDDMVEAICSDDEEDVSVLQRPPISDKELLSLEWLRTVSNDEAKSFLMGIDGLGRKSVACIMLLCLGKREFPVDTNVGRISARLGWIPLDSADAIEELDNYAPEPEVHAYLHSRLMHFDIETLYELHYSMITLGKIFCQKASPNCAACPLRESCEYALNDGPSLNGRKRQRREPIIIQAEPLQERVLEFDDDDDPTYIPAAKNYSPALVQSTAAIHHSHGGLQWKAKKLEQARLYSTMSLEQLNKSRTVAPRTPNLRRPWGMSKEEADNLSTMRAMEERKWQTSAAEKESIRAVNEPERLVNDEPRPLVFINEANVLEHAVAVEASNDDPLTSNHLETGAKSTVMNATSDAFQPLDMTTEVDQNPEMEGDTDRSSPFIPQVPLNIPSIVSHGVNVREADPVSDVTLIPIAEDATDYTLTFDCIIPANHLTVPEPELALVPAEIDIDIEIKRLVDFGVEISSIQESIALLKNPKALKEKLVAVSLAVFDVEGDVELSAETMLILAKRRYHQLAMVLHPDKCKSDQADTAFAVLGHAMNIVAEELSHYIQKHRPVPALPTIDQLQQQEYHGDDDQATVEEQISDELVWNRNRLVLKAHVIPEELHSQLPIGQDYATIAASVGDSVLFLSLTDIPTLYETPEWDRLRRILPAVPNRETEDDQSVEEGILLVSCRAALRRRFPLNGTYFQVNEVFVDHATVCKPIKIPKYWLEEKFTASKAIYFGLGVHYMVKGMNQKEVAFMFHCGHVCFRCFDSSTGAPAPLPHYLLPSIPTQTKSTWKPMAVRRAAKAAALGLELPTPLVPLDARLVRVPLSAADVVPPSTTLEHGERPYFHLTDHGKRPWTAVGFSTPKAKGLKLKKPSSSSKYSKNGPNTPDATDGQKRRTRHDIHPKMSAKQRCGHCRTCLNRHWKKACETRREEMLQAEELLLNTLSTPGVETNELEVQQV